MFNPDKYEHCTIYFDEKEVHLKDGTIVPINNMLTKKGEQTDDWEQVLYIQAGAGDCWVNLRLLD
jgi:hypothetical protein